MKRFILLIAAAWLGLWSAGTVSADTFGAPQMRRIAPKKIPAPRPHDAWDSTRVYRQMVLLIEYSDAAFSIAEPQAYVDRSQDIHKRPLAKLTQDIAEQLQILKNIKIMSKIKQILQNLAYIFVYVIYYL